MTSGKDSEHQQPLNKKNYIFYFSITKFKNLRTFFCGGADYTGFWNYYVF